MTCQFWLVSKPNSIWHQRLRKIVGVLGEITITANLGELANTDTMNKPRVVIIDASITDHVAEIVTRARTVNHRSLVLVVGDSMATWKDAREAFRAGASDYIPVSVTDFELYEIFKDAMISIMKINCEETV